MSLYFSHYDYDAKYNFHCLSLYDNLAECNEKWSETWDLMKSLLCHENKLKRLLHFSPATKGPVDILSLILINAGERVDEGKVGVTLSCKKL